MLNNVIMRDQMVGPSSTQVPTGVQVAFLYD